MFFWFCGVFFFFFFCVVFGSFNVSTNRAEKNTLDETSKGLYLYVELVDECIDSNFLSECLLG